MKVGRKFHFDAAHSIEGMEKCGRIHGHTYELEIIISGEKTKKDMIMDFGKVKEIVEEEILKKVDHQNLDQFMENPTAENLVKWIYEKLDHRFSKEKVALEEAKLWEGKNKWVSKQKNK